MAEGPHRADVIAAGYVFETDMANGCHAVVSEQLAPAVLPVPACEPSSREHLAFRSCLNIRVGNDERLLWRSHMQSMQKTMDRIHQADDSAEQKKLMHEHMQSMRDGMNMMGRMSQHGSKSMRPAESSMSSDAMLCKDDDKQCKRMKSLQMQQHSMQQRMQMMEMMMDQMMEQTMMYEQMSDG